MTTDAPSTSPEPEVTMCPRHPDVETALRCGRCDTLICPRCLVFTPGGTRCPDCAMLRRPVMYELEATHYTRAAAAAVGVAIGLAVAGMLLLPLTRAIPFFGLMLALAAGAGAGSLMAGALTWATNGKRGLALQVIAGLGLVAAWVAPLALFGALAAAPRDMFGLFATLVAVVIAWQRLR
jgi:hypothetical protein